MVSFISFEKQFLSASFDRCVCVCVSVLLLVTFQTVCNQIKETVNDNVRFCQSSITREYLQVTREYIKVTREYKQVIKEESLACRSLHHQQHCMCSKSDTTVYLHQLIQLLTKSRCIHLLIFGIPKL